MEVVGPDALPYQAGAGRGPNEPPIGPDWAGADRADLLQLAQGLDLRRLERDPEEHHRQGDPGTREPMDFDAHRGAAAAAGRAVERLVRRTATASSSAAALPARPRRAGAARSGRSSPSWASWRCRSPRSMAASAAAPVETMIVMEALGRALVLEPYLATVVLGGGLLAARRAPTSRRRRSSRTIAAGSQPPGLRPRRAAVALRPRRRRRRTARWRRARLRARRREDRRRARRRQRRRAARHRRASAAACRDRDGIGLFLVDAARARRVAARLPDRRTGSAPRRSPSTGVRVGAGGRHRRARERARRCIERVVDEAIAALCAEAVGVMAEMHDADRRVPQDAQAVRRRRSARFQALQHRAVDMFVALEQARCMAMFATP